MKITYNPISLKVMDIQNLEPGTVVEATIKDISSFWLVIANEYGGKGFLDLKTTICLSVDVTKGKEWQLMNAEVILTPK